jgi:hypothetical protein
VRDFQAPAPSLTCASGSCRLDETGVNRANLPNAVARFLHGVAALSPTDVWAVGRNETSTNNGLIEHVDGAS